METITIYAIVLGIGLIVSFWLLRRRFNTLENNVGSNFAAFDNYFDENETVPLYVDTPDPLPKAMPKQAKVAAYKYAANPPKPKRSATKAKR